jgi:hypothetical protein
LRFEPFRLNEVFVNTFESDNRLGFGIAGKSVETPSILAKNSSFLVDISKNFPCLGLMLTSGSNDLKICLFSSSRPLKTESTITKAIVPMPTPNIEISEMMLMKDCFLFEKKYRLAILKDKFIY